LQTAIAAVFLLGAREAPEDSQQNIPSSNLVFFYTLFNFGAVRRSSHHIEVTICDLKAANSFY